MQWLIDIVTAAVIADLEIPPVFVYRGDIDSYDFVVANLQQDQAWHTMSFLTVAPAGTKALLLNIQLTASSANIRAYFKHGDSSNDFAMSTCPCAVTNAHYGYTILVPCNSSRIIKYFLGDDPDWTKVNITCAGWIL